MLDDFRSLDGGEKTKRGRPQSWRASPASAGAYCTCIAALDAIGLLMGVNAAFPYDPVLGGVGIVFLVIFSLASWLDWRKAVHIERCMRENG